MNGIVENIRAYSAKGEAGRELAEARFTENMGLEGDFHATGGDRQVSLLFAESRDRLTEQKGNGLKIRGLCFSRFRENITVRGLTPAALVPGARLEAGEGVCAENGVSIKSSVVLEITGETKRCHAECSLYEAGKPCPLAGRSLFARVLKSGIIRIGDRVVFL